MYKKQLQHHGLDNQNLQKHQVSEEVKNIVRKNFSREIEFYEFCKKRLKVQLHKIQQKAISWRALIIIIW